MLIKLIIVAVYLGVLIVAYKRYVPIGSRVKSGTGSFVQTYSVPVKIDTPKRDIHKLFTDEDMKFLSDLRENDRRCREQMLLHESRLSIAQIELQKQGLNRYYKPLGETKVL